MTSELDAEAAAWFDASVIGVEVEIGTLEITPARIQSYCAALGDTNPLYFDPAIASRSRHGGLIAPIGLLISPQLNQGLDAKVRFGTTLFAAGDRVEIFEALRPGDRITARQMVKEVYPKTGRSGTMLFVVRRTTYTNQHGRVVATTEFSVVYREV